MIYSYKDGMAKTQGRTHACHVALVSAKPAAVRHLCSLLHDRKSLPFYCTSQLSMPLSTMKYP